MAGSPDKFDCYEASYKGALPRLKSLIDSYYKANKRDSHGAVPLHFAAQVRKILMKDWTVYQFFL